MKQQKITVGVGKEECLVDEIEDGVQMYKLLKPSPTASTLSVEGSVVATTDAVEACTGVNVQSWLVGFPGRKGWKGNRVQNLQETVAKFPLFAQLDPIIALVSTWQKMEFESRPALLDEVQARFDTNVGHVYYIRAFTKQDSVVIGIVCDHLSGLVYMALMLHQIRRSISVNLLMHFIDNSTS
ncbi:hypothetical protein Tco_0746839 [Tanacetum coccineum]